MANTITRGRLRRLAEFRPEHGRVLSVFFNLAPSEYATPAARATELTSVMHAAERAIADAGELAHAERAALAEDVERVRGVLQDSGVAAEGTHGVAVFACGPAGLLETVRLAQALESRAVVDSRPYVEPLVQVGAPERWGVLLANRREGRIFQGDGDVLEETDRIHDDVHRKHDQGGWSQSNYQRSVEKEKLDHLERVAEVLFAIHKERPFDRLLVAAPEELAPELEGRLHAYLRERLAGRVALDVENSGLDEVRAATAQVIEERARRREREALDRLVQGVGSGGRAAAGLADVLAALNEARVETLLVAQGYSAAGRVDRESGMLAPTDGPGPATLEEVPDVVGPAIDRALAQAADVLVIRRHDDLGPLGGIGAVLRF
jgi:peptide chain release factor subunit 1